MIFANNTFADTLAPSTTTLFTPAKNGCFYTPADRDVEYAYSNWWSDYEYVYGTQPDVIPVPWVIFDEEHKLHVLSTQKYKEEIARDQLETKENEYALYLEREEMRLMGL